MPRITICCPHCLFSKELDSASVPAGHTRVKCPKCGERFPLQIQSDQPAPPRRLFFEFRGTGRQYFGIWIVNTLLQMLTLGLYSPWAKVRKRQFFYGNTLLDEAPFEYLASPLVLLKGWLLAAVMFITYSLCAQIIPPVASALAVLFYLLIPWIIVRSRIFNTRNSAHRGVRFGFSPNYAEAYKVYAWLPLLVPFTLGLIFPYLIFRQRWFLAVNSRYGTTSFTFDARPGQYYRVFMKASLFMLAAAVFSGLLIALMGQMRSTDFEAAQHPALFLLPLAVMLAFWCVNLYTWATLTNLTWNSTSLAGSRFAGTLSPARIIWIQLTNILGIVLSCGLFTPWAAVRMAAYRISCLSLETGVDLNAFVAETRPEPEAVGEEIGDFFDIEIAL